MKKPDEGKILSKRSFGAGCRLKAGKFETEVKESTQVCHQQLIHFRGRITIICRKKKDKKKGKQQQNKNKTEKYTGLPTPADTF